LVLVSALAIAGAVLWGQFPFAFYSPDVTYHSSRLLRVAHGDYFTDPFSGTPTAYPSLFHAVFGTLNRPLQLGSLQLVRLLEVLLLWGLYASFAFLARAVLEDSEAACTATLALGLVVLAPSARYVLLPNPANFSLVLIFLGWGFLWRFLSGGGRRDAFLGLLFQSLGVNVVWYEASAVLAFTLAVAARLRREGRLRAPVLALGAAGAALPCLWTAAHFYRVREVLPSYLGHHDELVWWDVGFWVVRDCLVNFVTRGNQFFGAHAQRSAWAFLHYFVLVLPFCALLLLAAIVLRVRDRRRPPSRTGVLFTSALLALLFSLPLAATNSPLRVAWVQFPSFALLLLFAWRRWPESCPGLGPRLFPWISRTAAAMGLVCLACTVVHTDRPFTGALPQPTQAVVDFVAGIPDHRDVRIFLTEANLRRLTPFVDFKSFVSHKSGRYYTQDPVSTAALLKAYQEILRRGPEAAAALEAYDVPYMIFRHHDGGLESEVAFAYIPRGRVVLQNPEWVVIAR
jgi:hypothetical protein